MGRFVGRHESARSRVRVVVSAEEKRKLDHSNDTMMTKMKGIVVEAMLAKQNRILARHACFHVSTYNFPLQPFLLPFQPSLNRAFKCGYIYK